MTRRFRFPFFASLVVVLLRQFGRVSNHQECEVAPVGSRGLQ
jgi:hypothetical protein